MQVKQRPVHHMALLVITSATLLIGGAAGGEENRPSIAETKAIAEEGVHLRAADRDELRGDV